MKPRVAAIVTEYRPQSHADVIVGKLLEGYDLDGVWTEPRVRVASLYTDQVPDNDLSRAMSARHGVPIYGTIADALTLGGPELAVDGIVLIGEHGRYPVNERGQTVYPRRRFFDETLRVFRRSRRVVPIFCDKHLSYSWENAKAMYDAARELSVPFLAGSSLPVTWRVPPLEIPRGAPVREALGIAYGPIESYGFHALEMVQCLVERRAGGESGVAAVQCGEGSTVRLGDETGQWSRELFDAAWSRGERKAEGDPWASATEPVAFRVEYRDGLRTTVLLLNGATREFCFAASVGGMARSTRFRLESEPPFGHFAFLANKIEEMILTGAPPYPVERTLLASGILARLMESRYRGGLRLPTPELAVTYELEGTQ